MIEVVLKVDPETLEKPLLWLVLVLGYGLNAYWLGTMTNKKDPK